MMSDERKARLCRGIKSDEEQCSRKIKHPSGFCRHHRDQFWQRYPLDYILKLIEGFNLYRRGYEKKKELLDDLRTENKELKRSEHGKFGRITPPSTPKSLKVEAVKPPFIVMADGSIYTKLKQPSLVTDEEFIETGKVVVETPPAPKPRNKFGV